MITVVLRVFLLLREERILIQKLYQKLCIIKSRIMSDKEVKDFMARLDMGLKLAEKRMLQEKALRGETVVVYTEEEGIQYIPAQQLIADRAVSQ